MKNYIVFLFAFLVFGCGVKQTRSLLSTGNYDEVVDNAIASLRTNKDKKGKQDYVYMLEEAFAKAKERDENELRLLEKEASPRNYETVYTTYLKLHNRQEKIKPLLPLFLLTENRNAIFPMLDYTEKLIKSKALLSEYLYTNSKALLLVNDKEKSRKAFDDLVYLNQISPEYKNSSELMAEAKIKGTDYVLVSAVNETNQIIPANLLADVLDFNTYGLNDKWTVYENEKKAKKYYDYGINVRFEQIAISPERVNSREFIRERQVVVGETTVLDVNGKPVRDSNGNVLKKEVLKTVQVQIFEFSQHKACEINASVDYINLKTQQFIQSFPLQSGFIFENKYATFKGDRRACEDDYVSVLDRRSLPFPSNEQMVFDTAEDLKNKLKSIIKQNQR